jgi:SPP1 gp7 family putative phage head morphogenesis protein
VSAAIDATALIEFFDAPGADAFDVAPEQAVAFFKAKGLQTTFSYADMAGEAHTHAFTVAKMLNVDMLGQVRASLDSAMANGTPFREWADSLIPVLQSGGWWGRKEVLDPLTGQPMIAQLGSPWRLETIFRTNMQTAYAVGQWQEIAANADAAPFLMYDAIDDFRTRPLHASWDRRVMRWDHPWWRTHYPPNGYNCRCGVIQLSTTEVAGLGLQIQNQAPADGTYTWTNPRTGAKLTVPNGIDPGFAHNPGRQYLSQLQQTLDDKVEALPSTMKAAARSAKAQQAAAEALAATKQVQSELAAAQAKALLARAQAKAQAKAEQLAAQSQIDAIKGGKESAGKGATYKIKALDTLQKSGAWQGLPATEQLAQVLTLAGELKTKAEISSKLSLYKKAILDGKTPAPATVKAFQTLTPEDQAAFLAKVDAEKAAAEAKKAAEAAAAAKKAAGAVPSAQVQAPEPAAPDPATMVVIGRKTKGGTEGAIYQDTATGTKWVVKFNGSEDAVRNEVLAARLYNAAGVEAPELHSIVIGGRPALASRIIDGIVEVDAQTLAGTKSALEGFAVDAWLANWDVIGLNFDNIVLAGGRAVRIDVGGSLRYRAMGTQKGAAFGRTVGEIDSLRDGTNSQARAVFGKITQAELEAGAEKVLAVSEADIRALVARFGPVDQAERAALADLLIERQRDLARRFPAAADRVRARAAGAQAQPGTPARVTPQEQALVEASRSNGFGFKTDSGDVEDQMVVVNTLTRADGTPGTRGWLKARPDAAQRILDTIKATAGSLVTADPREAADAILAAIKGINTRALTGWEKKDLDRIDAAIEAFSRYKTQALAAMPNLRDGPRTLVEMTVEDLEAWVDQLRAKRASISVGAKGFGFADKFQHDRLAKASVSYTIGGKAGAVTWVRKPAFAYELSEIDRGRVKLTGKTHNLIGTGEAYEGTLQDGTRITFVTDTSANGLATRGLVQIDAPGAGTDATERVFAAMDQIGIKSARSTQDDRDDLYLNAFARLYYARDQHDLQKFFAIDAQHPPGAARTRAKLDYFKRFDNLDVEASDGWRQRDGQYQAFGHGRARLRRPDLDTPAFDAFAKGASVYHNPNYGKSAAPIWQRLAPIVDAGGQFASLTDRARRGVYIDDYGTASGSSDMQTGGGSYYFTRIVSSRSSSAGFYWKPSVLKRMDAVTYSSDLFGDVNDSTQRTSRRGKTVADFEAMKGSGSNETIFKDSLSLFDDLDFVRFESAAGRDQAIREMKARGYKTWPDGRKLEDVFKA